MSRGYGGSARLILHNENTIIYEYAPFNLNCPDYQNSDHIYDGLITIDKSAFINPEICNKQKHLPNGKKKIITKLIINNVDYSQLNSNGKIVIENSKFCWCTLNDSTGYIAFRLTSKIFDMYQENGVIPEQVSLMA